GRSLRSPLRNSLQAQAPLSAILRPHLFSCSHGAAPCGLFSFHPAQSAALLSRDRRERIWRLNKRNSLAVKHRRRARRPALPDPAGMMKRVRIGGAMERKPYLYQHLTWPEMRDAVKAQPVVIQPIGSVEDHGHHLPLDTDNFLIWSICEAAAQVAAGE